MADASLIDVLLAVHLRGSATLDGIAQSLERTGDEVEGAVSHARDGELVAEARGDRVQLTPEGRFVLTGTLARELAASGHRDELDGLRREFEALDRRLLDRCTDWQLRAGPDGPVPNDHTDADYDDAVIDAVGALHAEVEPVLERLVAVVPRLGRHHRRLRMALSRLQAGEHDYLTHPGVASYHSCWHQLHEELLLTLGIDRTTTARG